MSAPDPQATTSTKPKFHAVIAYVPEEFIWCDWLHQQLDNTPVPAGLVGKRTRHGFARPTRLQVFPDPRNPVHLARCATGLPPCRYLIVVCSPHSAKSAALDEQVRAFKRTETEDRIIVLVVDGDLDHGHDDALSQDADWLPTWLRWRLDENGGFRPAEGNERLIIDARTGKLPLPEARAHLLAALLDVSRSDLLVHGDLVSAQASGTLVATSAAPDAPPARRGSRGLLLAIACLVLAFGGALWWMSQTVNEAEARPSAPVIPIATVTQAEPPPTPAEPSPSTPTPVPKAVAAATATPPPATPAPPTATPAPAPAPATTVIAKATPMPPPPASATPRPKTTVIVFAPSDGPETPIRAAAPALEVAFSQPGAKDWHRLRDLGDTLFERGNREAGLLALTQATESGLRAAGAANAKTSEQLEVARLCFRVGALQKQFFTLAEARRTLEGAQNLLQRMRVEGEAASERDALVENFEELSRSTKQ